MPDKRSLESGTPPLEPQETKRTMGTRITTIGHGLIRRSRKRKVLERRIANFRKKATKLQEELKELDAACLAELGVPADEIAGFSLAHWDELAARGTRLIRYGTGEFRLRDIGHPAIDIADKDAFYAEARRKGVARKVIRRNIEPNIEALRQDLELAKRMRTVNVTYTTKMEIRPRHTDDRLESPLADEHTWTIVEPKRKE